MSLFSSIGSFFSSSGGGGLLGGLAGGLVSGLFNSKEAEENRDWQAAMSNTAHQREVADLKAAGLNPILSATGGKGASTPSGAQGTMPSMDLVSSAVSAKKVGEEIKLLKANSKIAEANARKADVEARIAEHDYDANYRNPDIGGLSGNLKDGVIKTIIRGLSNAGSRISDAESTAVAPVSSSAVQQSRQSSRVRSPFKSQSWQDIAYQWLMKGEASPIATVITPEMEAALKAKKSKKKKAYNPKKFGIDKYRQRWMNPTNPTFY